MELINKCNLTQSEYREKNVERIRRQLKISESWCVARRVRSPDAALSLAFPLRSKCQDGVG